MHWKPILQPHQIICLWDVEEDLAGRQDTLCSLSSSVGSPGIPMILSLNFKRHHSSRQEGGKGAEERQSGPEVWRAGALDCVTEYMNEGG
jgi:hypothetical protein